MKKNQSKAKNVEKVENTIAEPVTEKVIKTGVIMVKRKFDRWFVYFMGVRPENNVGCPCKTAKSALRYMFMLNRKYGAPISQNAYDRLYFGAQRGE